jgi:hypothetical protein
MTRVCNIFKIWLLSQLLWTLGVTQYLKECSLHKRKLPTSCPNLIFLVEFNPSNNETCRKVGVLLFVNLVGPSMLLGGWNFKPLPLEMSKQILFPLKDLVFLWPHPLFTHLGYRLAFPCCLVVEGQVHHIKQIMLSPMDLFWTHCNSSWPIAIILITQMEKHSILVIWNNIIAKFAFHLPLLVL